jgi:bifunctional non-homologous end joining protein LigD
VAAGDVEVRRGRRSVRLTHLDRMYWPDVGLRKRDLVDYYRAVAPVLLPHLRGRPQTLRRHYTVPRGPFVWEKDAPAEIPDWFKTVSLPAKSRRGAPVRYALVDDELSLLWLVEYGCIDFHVGTARADLPERPDFVLFDLDPAGVTFEDVVEAALLLRQALSGLGLDSHAMTTGGEGMHVRVPIARRHTHEEARGFATTVAVALRKARPDLITVESRVAHRRGVYVDAKMNGHGQQVVAPYSVRPLPRAPIATPLRWSEVRTGLDAAAFTLSSLRKRLERHGDLFEPLLRGSARLSPALARGSAVRGSP